MAVAQRLDLRQSQQLVMTPQLQQAIKMLQMSNLELSEYVAEELERNPILETPSGDGDGAPAEPRDGGDAPDAMQDGPARLEVELGDERLGRVDETFDTGSDNVFADESYADRLDQGANREAAYDGPPAPGDAAAASIEAGAWSTVGKGGSGRFDDADQSLEARIASGQTLREALLAQLGASSADVAKRLIASELIEQLDDAGYFRGEAEEVAQRLGCSQADVDAALSLIQSFEPTGVGARDLRECLALQLAERDRLDPAMAALLDNLDLAARRDIDKLRKRCRVDLDDLREMIQELRALDPKPGLVFAQDAAPPVVPDVFVYENNAQGWTVELNADTLPRVIMNRGYAADILRGVRGDDRSAQIKEYLAERQQAASWLLKSIDQRAKTILRVSSEIVRQQDGFLAYGVSALRPLNLKRVADAIDMHESTVSRVTSNKYISTPRGVFELKYFFTPAIGSTDGEETFSAEAIRHRIKRLIDGESPDDVLSDDRIVAILKDAGVDIARRTVTKYREALGLPSSIQRRRTKAAVTVF